MRIPPETIQRARSTDLAGLARARGISLNPRGKDLAGLCPFHDDSEPSLIITPGKNLFHCFSCGAGGDPIEFITKLDRLSFAQAVARLTGSGPEELDMEGHSLVEKVIEQYQRTLKNSKEALAYLELRGLLSEEAFKKFRIGFADGSLLRTLPSAQAKAGIQVRRVLKNSGLFRETGHEHFQGALVFPIFDEEGRLAEVYGRRIYPKGRFKHLYLPGPHRGIWNREAFGQPTLVLCESIIDALSFYVSGVRGVSAAFGTGGFTSEMLDAMSGRVKTVLIAYDNDAAGNQAAEKLSLKLRAADMEVKRIGFPAGMDANEFLLRHGHEELQNLVSAARPVLEEKATPAVKLTLIPDKSVRPEAERPEFEVEGEEVRFSFSERQYRVRGAFKNSTDHILKVNLRLSRGDVYFLDTLDLLAAKQRQLFIDQAAIETAVSEEILKYDLGRILARLETLLEERLQARKTKEAPVAIPPERREKALELARDPELIRRIVEDFEKCGLVGERINALTGYVGAVSRKTATPLAIIIQSSSSAGKTTLMDAILDFVPPEDQVRYSFLTGQSLYYMQSRDLRHKILAIAEEEGMERAIYALKLLQSDGHLTISSTVRDQDTGMPGAVEFTLDGPVGLFSTSTNAEINEEYHNRNLILTPNEERTQTRRIQLMQRQKRTLAGLTRQKAAGHILELHQDFQRLLAPLAVVIPFAVEMEFPDTRLRMRRDQEKFLTLIETIALLFQHQRTIECTADGVEYITATKEDAALASFLCSEIFGISLDELAPQTRTLLGQIEKLVAGECERLKITRQEYRFTRRSVREHTHWNDTRLKKHLDRLVDLEYLLLHGGGQGKLAQYELLYDGQGKEGERFIPGLPGAQVGPDLLAYLKDGNFSPRAEHFSPLDANFSPTSHGLNTPLSPTSHPGLNGHLKAHRAQNGQNSAFAEKPSAKRTKGARA